MLNFNDIKGSILSAEAEKVQKASEQKEKAEKATKALLDYTCELIEAHMSLDTDEMRIFAAIDRPDMNKEFWEKFEYNGLLFKTRLPEVLNNKLGEGIKIKFNSLSYGKEKTEDYEYVFFSFAVELD